MDELKRNGRTLALVSLGCAKNLVNSEEMLALLDEAGYTLVESMEEADAVVINTCGFIDSATHIVVRVARGRHCINHDTWIHVEVILRSSALALGELDKLCSGYHLVAHVD